MNTSQPPATVPSATAKSLDLSVSFKHSVEIAREIRYKNTNKAKTILQNVIDMKRAIPFRKYKQNVAHKRTMAAGRYPEKAAKAFLRLINSVEANAQAKGLNITDLKITKLMANLASIPFTGKRFRTSTKRTNLEIEVQERTGKKVSDSKGDASESKKSSKNKTKKETAETTTTKPEDLKP